jgi:large subunit ribosomal protein L24
MRIRKGDTVVVLTGKDKGRKGEVIRAIPSRNQVVIEGINVAKRHQKPTRSMQQGGILDTPMPVNVSNVALLNGKGEATRVGATTDSKGRKVRTARKGGGEL